MLWMNTTLISFTSGKSFTHRLPKVHTMNSCRLRGGGWGVKFGEMGVNRPLALRGHVTNAPFKQLVGILLMPNIERAPKNYLTPEI